MDVRRRIAVAVCLCGVIPVLVMGYLWRVPAQGSPHQAAAVAVITACIFALGIFVLYRLSRAVAGLCRSVEKLSRGEVVRLPPIEERTDTADLALSINKLSQHLIQNMDELERRAILLERSNQEFRRVSERRTVYFEHMVHELRAPLINIEKSSWLLLDREPAGNNAAFLKIINSNAQRLCRLVNDLLDIARMDAGAVELVRHPVAARELIEEAMNAVDSWRASHRQRFRLDAAPGLPMVQADKDRIIQVIVNLLTNAIKFSPSGGLITVRAYMVEAGPKASAGGADCSGQLAIAVRDSGCGIPPEKTKAVFERFTTLARAPRDSVPATGLGLPIAREIVQLHQGCIWVESVPPDGSTFTFTLPVASSAAPEIASGAGTDRRILVVDDDENIQSLLARELSTRGYNVETAADGAEALKKNAEAPFDLVISDLRMPRLDGIGCCESLKTARPGTAVIFMTGFPLDERQQEALRSCGYPCVSKPFDLPGMLELVKEHIGGTR